LRVIRRLAALHADSVRLGDVFGNRKQLRHGLPGLSGIVLIQAGDDHAHAFHRQFVHHGNQIVVKELAFIDAHDFRVRFHPGANLGRGAHV
jgi:hypothetical protein